MNYEVFTAIAAAAALMTDAADAGVVVSVWPGDDSRYVIWALAPDGNINEHSLDAGCTDLARLKAHVEGFIANHKRAWAR